MSKENMIPVGGRLHSVASGNQLAGADEIFDDNYDGSGKTQSEINAIVYEAIGDGGNVDQKIATAKQEIIGTASTSADTLGELETIINSEVTRAKGAESALDTKIDDTKSEIIGTASASANTLGEIETIINSEVSRAKGAESALDTKIDETKSDIIGTASASANTLGELETVINSEVARAKAAESTLDTKIGTSIETAVNSLDATVSQTAGADGLALQVVEQNGKLTAVTGSIAANTYDTYGAAADVKDQIDEVLDDVAYLGPDSGSAVVPSFDPETECLHITSQTLSPTQQSQTRTNIDVYSKSEVDGKIQGLDATVQGTSEDEHITVSVTETDGVITGVNCSTYDIAPQSNTYTKAEVRGMVNTPNQGYATYVATSATTAVTQVLPATGAADTIYRVSCWDGSANSGVGAYDITVYSEYTWDDVSNPHKYVFLCVKSQIGEVFDISAYHNNETYADLAAALGSGGINVPSTLRKGGMSVKYVQSSDNKYVQARCMAQNFTIDVTQWQRVDDEPTAGSKNLVESGGVDILCNQTPLVAGEFDWFLNKYYEPSSGNLIDAGTVYACSRILHKSYYQYISDAIDNLFYDSTSTKTMISFWNAGTYVGYRIKSGYKNPDGTSAETINFDSFAINLSPTVFTDYTTRFKLANIKDLLEIEGIVLPVIGNKLTWYLGRYYNITDGKWSSVAAYACTQKYSAILYDLLNGIDDILTDSATVISFWNAGTYVGYRIKSGYKNPDGTSAETINFDSFAISLHPSEFPNYQNNVVAYSVKDAKASSIELNTLKSDLNPLLYNGILKWGTGYYNLNTGVKTAGGNYVSTEKYPSRYYSLLGDSLDYILADNNSLVSFWNNGTYVGYQIKNKYYNPSGTEVLTINFDIFALNLRPIDFPNYDYEANIVVELSESKKFQFERNFYALGDSTTYGFGSTGNNVSWANILSGLAKFDSFTKLAMNSTFCMYHEGKPRLSTQVANIPQGTTGIVTVMIGTNDFFFDSPLGDASQTLAKTYSSLTDTDNFADSFRYNIETIKRNSPNAIIICMAPLPSYDANNAHHHLDETNLFAIREIERTICNAMGIPFVESDKEFGISRYVENWNDFFYDYCHPNDNGYQRIAHCMLGKLIECAQ